MGHLVEQINDLSKTTVKGVYNLNIQSQPHKCVDFELEGMKSDIEHSFERKQGLENSAVVFSEDTGEIKELTLRLPPIKKQFEEYENRRDALNKVVSNDFIIEMVEDSTTYVPHIKLGNNEKYEFYELISLINKINQKQF